MRKVLIIDDHPDLRRLVGWSLEMLDDPVELIEATDAEQGVALARELKPALVFLDVMMPGAYDGLEACRRITSDRSLAATRVVLLSAKGQAADVQTGLACGAHHYLVKPFSPQKLLAVAEELLGVQ
jgi:DNA-binding response OmpR family regulator